MAINRNRRMTRPFTSSSEVIAQLRSSPKIVSVFGVIRADGDSHVLVSEHPKQNGTRIPVEQISAVEPLGYLGIGENAVPIGRLTLRAPSHPEGEPYASLLKQHPTGSLNATAAADVEAPAPTANPIGFQCPNGYMPQWNGSGWICVRAP